MKMKVILLLAIAIAAALLTQPMRASVIDNLVITENSPTSLTAILDGTPLSVTNTSADNWNISLFGISDTQQNWTEPGAAGVVNLVQGQNSNGLLIVHSDFGSGLSGLADGTT